MAVSVTPNPANAPSEEAKLQEKLEKADPGAQEFLERAHRADVEGLKKMVVEASNVAVEAKNAMNANDTIRQLKEALKQEAGPFRDTIKISRLREELLYKYLEAKGAV